MLPSSPASELSLLHHIPRTSTIRTLTPTVFFTLSPSQFSSFVQVAPEFAEGLEQYCSQQCETKTTQYASDNDNSYDPIVSSLHTPNIQSTSSTTSNSQTQLDQHDPTQTQTLQDTRTRETSIDDVQLQIHEAEDSQTREKN